MRAILTAALVAALFVSAAPASAVVTLEVRPYWQTIDNCDHGHRSQVAKKRITDLLHAPYVRRGKVRHYNRCVATREKRRYLTRVVRAGWEWRAANYWPIQLARQDSGWRAWAWSTAGCESGGTFDPTIHNPSGIYHGLMQFSLSTARVAGFTTDPHNTSTAEQLVRGIWLAQRHGTQHWPVCG